jgi:hypothetical protein
MVHVTVFNAYLVQVRENQPEFCPVEVQDPAAMHRNRASERVKASPDSRNAMRAPKRLMGPDARAHVAARVRQTAGKVAADDSMA